MSEYDADAIARAKFASKTAMESAASPEHIEVGERRKGIILFIDRITGDGRQAVIEDVAFSGDRAHTPTG